MSKNRKEEEEAKEMVSCDFTPFLLSAEDDTSFLYIYFSFGYIFQKIKNKNTLHKKRNVTSHCIFICSCYEMFSFENLMVFRL